MIDTEYHYAAIVALLLAYEVQARLVRGRDWVGVEVKEGGDRILWANVGEVWRWTKIHTDTGENQHGATTVSSDASPEDVALSILMAYAVPEDGPSL